MDPFGAREPTRPGAASKEEFARFYGREHPPLVALLHVLRGDRAHAQQVADRAFVRAWMSWPKVRTLPDPGAWVRRLARRTRQPRNVELARYGQACESEWIAPHILPFFTALGRLSSRQRTLLALHHVGRLTVEQIGEEEGLAPGTVTMDLASARAALTYQLDGPAQGRDYTDVRDTRAAEAMGHLVHALSYTSDRRSADQVFRAATRQRVYVGGAAALVVLIGTAGAVAAVQHLHAGVQGNATDGGRPAPHTPPTTAGEAPGYPPAAPTPQGWGGARNRAVAPKAEGSEPVASSESGPGKAEATTANSSPNSRPESLTDNAGRQERDTRSFPSSARDRRSERDVSSGSDNSPESGDKPNLESLARSGSRAGPMNQRGHSEMSGPLDHGVGAAQIMGGDENSEDQEGDGKKDQNQDHEADSLERQSRWPSSGHQRDSGSRSGADQGERESAPSHDNHDSGGSSHGRSSHGQR
jgi:DNA-directed RNA polymerase specialized sigma24 family protein